MEKYTNIKNYLLTHANLIGEIVNEVNCLDSSLEYLQYWNNDEEFFNTFFYNNAMDAVKASYFGSYDFSDEYVKFDAYGNLSSANEYEVEAEYKDYIDNITKSLIEHYEEMNITDKELKELINEF